MTANVLQLGVKEYEQKALLPLIRLASIRRFSRSAITRQLPDQALGDTAQARPAATSLNQCASQHNAGQD